MLQRLATLIILLVAGLPLSAQWLDLPTPGIPRTANGQADLSAVSPRDTDGNPDLSGLWVPGDARGSLFDTNKTQKWARQFMAEQESNFFGNDPRFHCLPGGPGSYPAGRIGTSGKRIVQQSNFITILNADLTYRQIFLDGRELETDPFPTWMGYSVGHWDGDYLVIESNGFNGKTWLTRSGLPHTDRLQITERYRRVDFGHIELEVTYDDPGTFTEPVQVLIVLEYVADSEMLETVCNESSEGLSHWNGKIKHADEKVVEVPDEILEIYVGTYQGIWLGGLIKAEFLLENGEMFLVRTPPYPDVGNFDSAKTRLIAQSETAFDCSCGIAFVFKVDDEGVATEVEEVHVSGAWTFNRAP
jgi:hypothetical protein